ncbi:MAG TPA: hypothetical protein DC042_09955, partial [Bacteroidales bacterium]|nr:hypothetical protein [Bacteroidales bacterium]
MYFYFSQSREAAKKNVFLCVSASLREIFYKNEKKLYLSLAIALLFNCFASLKAIETSPSARIVLTGTLKNFKDSATTFSWDAYKFLSSTVKAPMKVNPDGTFKLVLESDSPLKGFFSLGKVPKTYEYTITTVEGKDSSMSVESFDFLMVYVWLEPGDSVTMNLDIQDISKTLKFKGNGSANCTFVNREADIYDAYKYKYLGNYYNYTFRQPNDMKRVADQLRREKLAFLDKYRRKHKLSSRLVEIYKSDYITDATRSKLAYPGSHAGFNNGREAILPADYYAFLDSLPAPVSIGSHGIGYYYYLSSVLRRKVELQNPGAAGDDAVYAFAKKELPGPIAYEYIAYALARDFRKVVYDEFGDGCPYPEIAAVVREKYIKMEGMLEGSPAPDVTLRDVHGRPVSLKDL